jgi:polyisoprenyl-phosphate glycosyltransferase
MPETALLRGRHILFVFLAIFEVGRLYRPLGLFELLALSHQHSFAHNTSRLIKTLQRWGMSSQLQFDKPNSHDDAKLREPPVLAIVVPCYNEQEVLPSTIPALMDLLKRLAAEGSCSIESFVAFVDDGSKDDTWSILTSASHLLEGKVRAIRLAGNSGHQNAILAGIEYATGKCDASITVDADLQDDLNAIDHMVAKYRSGDEIVLGVRSDRVSDTAFKRMTAGAFYAIMKFMGVDAVPQHADFRLLSSRAMTNLARFQEYHVYLRGYPKLLHSRISTVKYSRAARMAGETKYPLHKMLSLGWNGITSFSVIPLRLIGLLGGVVFVVAAMLSIYAVVARIEGAALPGWASVTVPLYALGGMIMLSVGVVGEYVGKIYIEVKRRPRYLLDRVEPSDD